MTMLQHMAGLRQIYDRMRFTKKIVRKSYEKHTTKL